MALGDTVSPWVPMTDPTDLKCLGKFNEELGECAAAVSRCIIQGIDEVEPITGKINKQWLEEEIADVLANMAVCINRFKLDDSAILKRKCRKEQLLIRWHKLL